MPTKKIEATVMRKRADELRLLANVLEEAASLLARTEREHSLPRTEHDQTLKDIGEHYNSLADDLEGKAIDLLGGDVDKYLDITDPEDAEARRAGSTAAKRAFGKIGKQLRARKAKRVKR